MRGCLPGRQDRAARWRRARSRPRCCATGRAAASARRAARWPLGTHADLLLVRPDGLSYGVRQTRDLVLKAAAAPVYGRWRIVLFEDADRCHRAGRERAAQGHRGTVAADGLAAVRAVRRRPADDDQVAVPPGNLVTPRTSAVTEVLEREGIPAERARAAALAAQGHIGRARRLATDEEAARRRGEVLASARPGGQPRRRAPGGGRRWSRRPRRRPPRRRRSWTSPSARRCGGRSARARPARASPPRYAAGPVRCGSLRSGRSRGRPGSSGTRWTGRCWTWPGSTATCSRSSSARRVELANEVRGEELRQQAAASGPGDTVRRIEAIMRCRQRLEVNVAPLLAVEELTLALAG